MAVSTKKRLYISLVFPAVCLLLLWGVEGMERLANWDLSWLGIFPRSLKGIVGILTAPLIHGGWEHLVSNSTPFFFLSAGLIYFYRPIAPKVLLLIYLLSGLWVWVAGRQVWHIGLSGVIYGLAFFLFFSGVFRKNAQSLALALVVALFYGSMVWGVLPLKAGTSWESHLFGALAGILAAFHFRRVELAIKTKRYEWEKEPEWAYDTMDSWNYRRILPPPDGYSYPEEQ